jgi:hypothetical protein
VSDLAHDLQNKQTYIMSQNEVLKETIDLLENEIESIKQCIYNTRFATCSLGYQGHVGLLAA